MILSAIKKPLRYVRNSYRQLVTGRMINKIILERSLYGLDSFNFDAFKSKVSEFLISMQTDTDGIHYRYSNSCSKPTLYASAYACMTLSLLGTLKNYNDEAKRKWANYFDSFQSSEDGLFYDTVVMNEIYQDSDWWGARHITMHMLSAYTDLGYRPKYKFNFLAKYYDTSYIQLWIDDYNWQDESFGAGDIDNKIMNIASILQYQRDFFGDADAGKAVEYIKVVLRNKINAQTGLWGGFNTKNQKQLSRMVQFAYHLFSIYFYDKEFNFDTEKIVQYVLNTQNKFGGYGVQYNSSACEDIDSIDILIRFYPHVNYLTKEKIKYSIHRAFKWVMVNHMRDGGFVFRLHEPFVYGDIQTSSMSDFGGMLPTWFRTLSLAYMSRFLCLNQSFRIVTAPGCEI